MIILDFDGVIADTAIECMYVAERAFCTNGPLNSKQQKIFLDNRYLVNDPYGFKLLIAICEVASVGVGLDEVKSEFRQREKKLSPDDKCKIKTLFFETRGIIKSALNEDEWMALMPSYDFIEQLWLPDKCVTILSAKDENTIASWLSYHELTVNDIYGSKALEPFSTKFDFIRRFQHRHQFLKTVFIDDNIENVDDFPWSSVNCHAYLASWGYNLKEDNNQSDILRDLQKAYDFNY